MASLNQADSRLSREKCRLHGYKLEADPRKPQRFCWFRLKRHGNFGLEEAAEMVAAGYHLRMGRKGKVASLISPGKLRIVWA